MASKKARKALAKDARPLRAKVVMKVTKDLPTYYIDHVEVGSGIHDFSLIVAKLPGRFTAEELSAAATTGELEVEPLLQLYLPPTLIPALIKALNTQKDAFEEMQGPIRDPSAEPPVRVKA
jgi:hypothetical protein